MTTALQVFRRAIKAISIAIQADVQRLPARSDAYFAALPGLVDLYGTASSVAAGDFYTALREAAGVEDTFDPVFLELGDQGVDSLIGWAGFTAQSPESFASLVAGGVQRRVANHARETIIQSSHKDPKALGWMRIGSPDCDFCAMLISRGAVYTEKSADFAAHDHCDCLAVPAFDPSQVRKVKTEFVASARRRSEASTDADRARSREWIAENL